MPAAAASTNGFAVLYLDLDRFKIVNDSLGHMVGDELLIAASRRLETCLRQGDALARLGGDEFAILLNGLNDDAQANAIAGRIQDALSAPFSIAGREVFTSASIGIAFGPAHYTNPDEIMRDADTAMYHAKSRGKARHEVFDAAMHARVRDRLSLENDLRRAVAANDFEVHYQPIVTLDIRHVRRLRVARPLEAQRRAGVAGDVRADRRGARPDRAARHVGAPGSVPHVRRAGSAAIPAAGLDCITVNVSSRQLVQQNFLRVVQQHRAADRPASRRTCGSRSPKRRCSTVPARPPACCASCATSA